MQTPDFLCRTDLLCKAGREKDVGGWATRGFWTPPKYFEINAWSCFEERFNKLIRGKGESNTILGTSIREAESPSQLTDTSPYLLLNQSCTNLSGILENSIDYIFTDPPYGDAIPYLELDLLWSSWLGFTPNFDDEIIISDSPIRNKHFDEYNRLLMLAFREIFRVLKPTKWLTVTFHSTDIKIYNSIIRSVVYAGFKLDKILYQYPARASAKALLAPYGSAVGDYYIRFFKPEKPRLIIADSTIDPQAFENVVVESIKGIMAERGEPVTYNDILKNIYTELDKYGFLMVADPIKIQSIITKYKDNEFEFIEGKGWWLKNPSEFYLHVIPLNERVEKSVVQILRRKDKITFDDVLQDIFLRFKNALTPSPRTVSSILEEYADKVSGGKWKLKPSFKIREDEHSKLIHFLCYIGTKFGFNVYSGHSSATYEGVKVLELPNYLDIKKLKGIDETQLSKIKEIDVVWHKDGRISNIFEVENTTGITDALIRAANIPYAVNRNIVLPEERDQLLQSRMREPMLESQFANGHWGIIYYGTLSEFIEEHKRKSFSMANFISIIGIKSMHRTLATDGQLALFKK